MGFVFFVLFAVTGVGYNFPFLIVDEEHPNGVRRPDIADGNVFAYVSTIFLSLAVGFLLCRFQQSAGHVVQHTSLGSTVWRSSGDEPAFCEVPRIDLPSVAIFDDMGVHLHHTTFDSSPHPGPAIPTD